MTNQPMTHPRQQMPVPPAEAIRREQRRSSIMLTIGLAIVGALLVAGALFWTGSSQNIDAGTTEVATAVATETSLAESTANTDLGTTSAAAVTGLTDVSDIAATAVDSVVVVEVTIDARGPFDATASGSGVIISEDGVIVTNAHVVDDARSIVVELTDGTTYQGTVLYQDSSEDIAILDIDTTGLAAIELGSTADLLVGDPVIAVGNPLGLDGGPSVSTGIVSALDRVLQDEDATLTGIIQTDAAITEGSSGGALLDADGRLVGITTAVGVSSVGVEGIAFAVPVETVAAALGALSGV